MSLSQDRERHIASGGGICGTCAEPAEATGENEGYSYCCNDRIEYDDEARETVAREERERNCTHETTKLVRESVAGFDRQWRTVEIRVCACCDLYISEAV